MKHRNTILVLIAVVLVSASFANGVGPLQSGSRNALSFQGVESETCREATRLLRESKNSLDEDNGEEIVFCDTQGIMVQFLDGTGRRVLINRNSSVHQYYWASAWSLNGTHLAFAAVRNDQRVVDLAVADADGSNETVILTLDAGYFSSAIQSISWDWTDQAFLFTYIYDDSDLNTLYVTCQIHSDGSSFVIGDGPDRPFVACEPTENSARYAFVSSGSPFDMNSRLHVLNYNGTNHTIWMTHSQEIAYFRDVCWRNATSIYTVVQLWNPMRQGISRINSDGTETGVLETPANWTLNSPAFAPSRNVLYVGLASSSEAHMERITLNSQGDFVSSTMAGSGVCPNWRQVIPQPPAHVNLTYPTGGERFARGSHVVITWTLTNAVAEYFLLDVSTDAGQSWFSLNNEQHLAPGLRQLNALIPANCPLTNTGRARIRAFLHGGVTLRDTSGNFTVYQPTLGAEEDTPELVDNTALIRNYPNPFNLTTTVEYVVPRPGWVLVEIWNCEGQLVRQLASETQTAGRHRLRWNASELGSGIYYLTLRTDREVKTCKALLVK